MGAGKEPLRGTLCPSRNMDSGIRETGAAAQKVSGMGRHMLRTAAAFVLMLFCVSPCLAALPAERWEALSIEERAAFLEGWQSGIQAFCAGGWDGLDNLLRGSTLTFGLLADKVTRIYHEEKYANVPASIVIPVVIMNFHEKLGNEEASRLLDDSLQTFNRRAAEQIRAGAPGSDETWAQLWMKMSVRERISTAAGWVYGHVDSKEFRGENLCGLSEESRVPSVKIGNVVSEIYRQPAYRKVHESFVIWETLRFLNNKISSSQLHQQLDTAAKSGDKSAVREERPVDFGGSPEPEIPDVVNEPAKNPGKHGDYEELQRILKEAGRL